MAERMISCPSCGKPAPQQSTFCSYCGATWPRRVPGAQAPVAKPAPPAATSTADKTQAVTVTPEMLEELDRMAAQASHPGAGDGGARGRVSAPTMLGHPALMIGKKPAADDDPPKTEMLTMTPDVMAAINRTPPQEAKGAPPKAQPAPAQPRPAPPVAQPVARPAAAQARPVSPAAKPEVAPEAPAPAPAAKASAPAPRPAAPAAPQARPAAPAAPAATAQPAARPAAAPQPAPRPASPQPSAAPPAASPAARPAPAPADKPAAKPAARPAARAPVLPPPPEVEEAPDEATAFMPQHPSPKEDAPPSTGATEPDEATAFMSANAEPEPEPELAPRPKTGTAWEPTGAVTYDPPAEDDDWIQPAAPRASPATEKAEPVTTRAPAPPIPKLPVVSTSPEAVAKDLGPSPRSGKIGYSFRAGKARGRCRDAIRTLDKRKALLTQYRDTVLLDLGRRAWLDRVRPARGGAVVDALEPHRARIAELENALRLAEAGAAEEPAPPAGDGDPAAATAEAAEAQAALKAADAELAAASKALRESESGARMGASRAQALRKEKKQPDWEAKAAALDADARAKAAAIPQLKERVSEATAARGEASTRASAARAEVLRLKTGARGKPASGPRGGPAAAARAALAAAEKDVAGPCRELGSALVRDPAGVNHYPELTAAAAGAEETLAGDEALRQRFGQVPIDAKAAGSGRMMLALLVLVPLIVGSAAAYLVVADPFGLFGKKAAESAAAAETASGTSAGEVPEGAKNPGIDASELAAKLLPPGEDVYAGIAADGLLKSRIAKDLGLEGKLDELGPVTQLLEKTGIRLDEVTSVVLAGHKRAFSGAAATGGSGKKINKGLHGMGGTTRDVGDKEFAVLGDAALWADDDGMLVGGKGEVLDKIVERLGGTGADAFTGDDGVKALLPYIRLDATAWAIATGATAAKLFKAASVDAPKDIAKLLRSATGCALSLHADEGASLRLAFRFESADDATAAGDALAKGAKDVKNELRENEAFKPVVKALKAMTATVDGDVLAVQLDLDAKVVKALGALALPHRPEPRE